MSYHIDTGLIKEKFKVDCECPLCEIKKIVEEQFLHEFLNDAVMEDSTRQKVNEKGFCQRHFDMLFNRPNKLSVALQTATRVKYLQKFIENTDNAKKVISNAKKLEELSKTCIICDYTEASMVKYYKTIAQMFVREKSFYKTLFSSKGFCLKHYTELIKYSKSAGYMAKDYVNLLASIQNRNVNRLSEELKVFCDKHDYRNANMPLGSSETALPRMRIKLYGDEKE